MKIYLLLLFVWHSDVEGSFINPYPKFESNSIDLSKDVGEPLILTPHIEKGKINLARKLARVKLTDGLGIKSYSGFFTVNKKHNSNQFFWYFPPTSSASADAPVILWLQGGPGSSSLFGLFSENGPIKVENGKFLKRKYHWAIDHHVIYIDNPVGTGFSFTDDDGYAKDEVQVGAELYESLIQFYKLFPHLKQNKFFITGESYAGKYIPALGYTIHVNNINSSNDKINLKGLAIGNGFSDPINQLGYGKYLYQLGLIDLNQLREINNYESQCIQYIKDSDWNEALHCSNSLLYSIKRFTGIKNIYNYIQLNSENVDEYVELLVTPAVRKAIHVGDQLYDNGNDVYDNLGEDTMKSVASWIIELLNNYEMVFFSGQLDIIVAYPLTEDYLQKLAFADADQYKTAERHIWKVDGDVAGYVKTAGRLTEILVRDAGHMVPEDQPIWALDLITRFTHGKPFF